MEIKLIKRKISLDELKEIAQEGFGEMVKAVVDIQQEVLAVGGELHADAEALLVKKGSKGSDLWGINIYVNRPKTERIEFSALINIKPSKNRSMEIQDSQIKEKIAKIVDKLIE